MGRGGKEREIGRGRKEKVIKRERKGREEGERNRKRR